MKFIIVSLDENIKTFKNIFKDLNNFEIKRTNILQISHADCIVSPANSYGLMDGGVDRTINYALNISPKIQNIIKTYYFGEQPVGTCFITSTNNANYKYIAHTPTMRIPTNVNNTTNAYIAFRALLKELINHNKIHNDIHTILMTPFCIGAGLMSPLKAAKQMRLAYDLINANYESSWKNAKKIDTMLKNL